MKTAKRYLRQWWDGKSPLLLGYSGGPDSKALLYLLLEMGISTIHVAHVDHGWRQTSLEEAERLEAEARGLNIPFHTTRLSCVPSKNMEAHGRQQRLCFFRSLFSEIPFQALLLAHQADDLAETSLKRVLEGAHLPFLGGLALRSELEGMAVWRPLLNVKKRAILDYLQEKRLDYLTDPTNGDIAFLRGRMRTLMIPDLSVQFGKGVSDNLILLGQRAEELKEYLDLCVANTWQNRTVEDGKVTLNCRGLHRIEVRHLLQKVVRFSRDLLESAVEALVNGRMVVRYEMKGQRLQVDNGFGIIYNGTICELDSCNKIADVSSEI